jgi:nucleoid-associated protein YgaU
MFSPTSRYYNLATATYTTSSGRTVAYVRRRFLPQGEAMPLLVELTIVQGDRLDLITSRTLGDPEQFWRICDANNAMDPQDLVDAGPGSKLRVPAPQF